MQIGLLGFGTVGKGFYDVAETLPGIKIKYVLDLRDLPELGEKLCRDIGVILQDKEVDTVVELIGGLHPAYEMMRDAILSGKNVVTANKLVVSLHYGELVRLAREKNVSFRFSAAAGGGIPWLVNLQRAHRASDLDGVYGIMNGTTNYILDAMATLGAEFEKTLAEAQALGFAEADPSSDIDGLDTRHKTTLSANVAFGVELEDEKVDTFGIRYVKKCDMESASEKGYVIKLIGSALRVGENKEEIAAFVEPTLVPGDMPEGNIHGCDNIITFDGTFIGKTHFVGAGAGRYPTGYAVAQDCLDISRGLGGLYNEEIKKRPIANEKEVHPYYVRTGFLEDAFFASLEKEPFGAGYKVEKTSVREMHDFAARAKKAGKEIFFAGFWKN